MPAGAVNPCALHYNSTVSGNTHEWLITGRVDQNFGQNDRAFAHFRMDRGLQATYIDPLTPTFNQTSNQPQYEGQLQWIHNFGVRTTNSFNLNSSYYSAIFRLTDQATALALQPLQLNFAGNAFYTLGRDYQIPNPAPQGRRVTQYGFVDDLSRIMGNHTLKVGANMARYDITTAGPGHQHLAGRAERNSDRFLQWNWHFIHTGLPCSFDPAIEPLQPRLLWAGHLACQKQPEPDIHGSCRPLLQPELRYQLLQSTEW